MTTKKLYFNGNKNTVTESIENVFYSGGFIDASIQGKKGSGKTSFALHTGAQVYGTYKQALDHLYFDPDELLNILRKVLVTAKESGKSAKRLPLIIFDDSAMTLSKSQWWKDEIQDFSSTYNVVRSACAGILFTSPSGRLPLSISQDIEYKIVIKNVVSEKRMRDCEAGLTNLDNRDYWLHNIKQAKKYGISNPYLWKEARVYSFYTIPSSDKKFISDRVDVNNFTLHYPNNIFKEYEQKRYTLIINSIDKALNKNNKSVGRPSADSGLMNKVVRDRYLDLKKHGKSRAESAKIIGVSEDMLNKYIDKANKVDKENIITPNKQDER